MPKRRWGSGVWRCQAAAPMSIRAARTIPAAALAKVIFFAQEWTCWTKGATGSGFPVAGPPVSSLPTEAASSAEESSRAWAVTVREPERYAHALTEMASATATSAMVSNRFMTGLCSGRSMFLERGPPPPDFDRGIVDHAFLYNVSGDLGG